MGEGINILQLVDDVSMHLRIFKRFAQLGAQQSPPGFIGGSNMRKRSYSCSEMEKVIKIAETNF